MADIHTVLLDQLAFIEINYQYELIATNGRPPQCLLLFGHEFSDKIIHLNRSFNIPLTLVPVDDSCASFDYDFDQVNRRIELIECTNPDIKPLGAIILNESLYDYSTTLERLMMQVDGLRYLFTYAPHQETPLCCYSMILNDHRLTLNRVHYELKSSNSNVDLGISNIVEDELINEKELAIKLAGKVDRMIQYLRDSKDIDPKVMRSISLLVSRLKRPSTNDIKEEIMNKESEISAFKVACEQWEIGVSLLRNNSSD